MSPWGRRIRKLRFLALHAEELARDRVGFDAEALAVGSLDRPQDDRPLQQGRDHLASSLGIALQHVGVGTRPEIHVYDPQGWILDAHPFAFRRICYSGAIRAMSDESAPKLVHLIYCSAARERFTPQTLAQLLQHARRHNAEQGLTGMLLYTEGSFFQVLEGEEKAVDALFASIAGDQRHFGVTVIVREPISRRAFADWTMGFADMSAVEVDSVG